MTPFEPVFSPRQRVLIFANPLDPEVKSLIRVNLAAIQPGITPRLLARKGPAGKWFLLPKDGLGGNGETVAVQGDPALLMIDFSLTLGQFYEIVLLSENDLPPLQDDDSLLYLPNNVTPTARTRVDTLCNATPWRANLEQVTLTHGATFSQASFSPIPRLSVVYLWLVEDEVSLDSNLYIDPNSIREAMSVPYPRNVNYFTRDPVETPLVDWAEQSASAGNLVLVGRYPGRKYQCVLLLISDAGEYQYVLDGEGTFLGQEVPPAFMRFLDARLTEAQLAQSGDPSGEGEIYGEINISDGKEAGKWTTSSSGEVYDLSVGGSLLTLPEARLAAPLVLETYVDKPERWQVYMSASFQDNDWPLAPDRASLDSTPAPLRLGPTESDPFDITAIVGGGKLTVRLEASFQARYKVL